MRPKSLFFLGIGIILRTSERAAPSADAAPHQGRGPPQSHQAGPLLQRVARPVFVVARAVAIDRLDVQRFLCAGQQDTRICGGIRSSQKNHLRLCSHDILKTSFTKSCLSRSIRLSGIHHTNDKASCGSYPLSLFIAVSDQPLPCFGCRACLLGATNGFRRACIS